MAPSTVILRLLPVLAASVVAPGSAFAGTVTEYGAVTALSDVDQMAVPIGTASFDGLPFDVPADTYSAQGLTFQWGELSGILPGVTTQGFASLPWSTEDAPYFPAPIAGGGTASGAAQNLGAVATLDVPVTRFGLTASSNGTQYLVAWNETGDLIGQVRWEPDNDAAFIGLDSGTVPIAMISWGNDDLWGGGDYTVAGVSSISDSWIWSGGCPNGVEDVGEECDDGNDDNLDACLEGCVAAACGDAFVHAGVEACDDGDDDNADTCLDTCQLASCGDGFVQAGVEECDDADLDDTDACPSTCLISTCGDGFVRAGVEECDDANEVDDDECGNDCTLADPGTETASSTTGTGNSTGDAGTGGSGSDADGGHSGSDAETGSDGDTEGLVPGTSGGALLPSDAAPGCGCRTADRSLPLGLLLLGLAGWRRRSLPGHAPPRTRPSARGSASERKRYTVMMPAEARVRVATPEDAEAATKVLRRSIAELCVADHQNDSATLDQWLANKTPERFRVWVDRPNRYVVVAEREGPLCGVGMLGTDGIIYLCYVHPTFVRCGVGRALIAALEARARSLGIRRLSLVATITAARFYEALGYCRCGALKPGFGVTQGYPCEKRLPG